MEHTEKLWGDAEELWAETENTREDVEKLLPSEDKNGSSLSSDLDNRGC